MQVGGWVGRYVGGWVIKLVTIYFTEYIATP
jgi:hypothetical protein